MWAKKKSNPFYGYENKYLLILKRLEAGHLEATVSTDWTSFISLTSHFVLNQNQKQIKMDTIFSVYYQLSAYFTNFVKFGSIIWFLVVYRHQHRRNVWLKVFRRHWPVSSRQPQTIEDSTEFRKQKLQPKKQTQTTNGTLKVVEILAVASDSSSWRDVSSSSHILSQFRAPHGGFSHEISGTPAVQ